MIVFLTSFQWLTAVELGLLKGRHPLLEDVDITINPSKGVDFVEGKVSSSSSEGTKLLNVTPPSTSRGDTRNPINGVVGESSAATGLVLRSRKLTRKYENEYKRPQEVENGSSKQTISSNADVVEEEETSVETESSEVLPTAKLVMNMLDVTMPGALTEEKKKKVRLADEFITSLHNVTLILSYLIV